MNTWLANVIKWTTAYHYSRAHIFSKFWLSPRHSFFKKQGKNWQSSFGSFFVKVNMLHLQNHTADIRLNGGRLTAFPQRSETTQRCLFLQLLFNNVWIDRVVNHVNEIKCIQTGKKEIKLSLFIDDMILFIFRKSPKIIELVENYEN